LAPVQTTTIRAIQRELAGRGYQAGQVDGIAGLMTRAAIMAFEYDQGLVLTAMPTQAVLHQILLGQRASGPVGRSLRAKYNQHARRVIDTIQQSLVRLGYMRPPRGSLLSEGTERAIREFEMDQGLIATGRISGKLVAALARASRSATRPRARK
jgi:peptidoglycan hydrolase-like protein with peptidoglycan-binding domain